MKLQRHSVVVNWTNTPFETTYHLEEDKEGVLCKSKDVKELETKVEELEKALDYIWNFDDTGKNVINEVKDYIYCNEHKQYIEIDKLTQKKGKGK